MKKKYVNRVLIFIAVFLVLITGRLGYIKVEEVKRQAILDMPLRPLTMEQKIQDFEYLYKTIEDNYPYIEVNKRVNNVDFRALKESYIRRIKDTQMDEDYFCALSDFLSELNNDHTQMLPKNQVVALRTIYSELKKEGMWQGINFDTINDPYVLRRYGIEDKIEQSEFISQKQAMENVVNAEARDVLKDQIGYIRIPQMLMFWQIGKDRNLINKYIRKIKGYKGLIIDIRGNKGGDSRYWMEYLLPQLISKTYMSQTFSFLKNGEQINKYFKANKSINFLLKKVEELDKSKMSKLPSEVYKDFTYYIEHDIKIKPSEESVKFKGNIYLLVDKEVYSSSEMLAVFAKDTGLMTLIGEKTGGDGIGSDPLLAKLPNSGYVFRFAKEMGTSEDGTCNEEHKTTPHYEVDATRISDFKEDKCIQQVLALEGLN